MSACSSGTSGGSPRPPLAPEQLEVLRLVAEGCNVFFTGSAGTGKSFTLERVVEALRVRYPDEATFREKVAVTATTGVAATNVGGQTLNSALGLGAPQTRKDFRNMLHPRTKARLRAWDVLVVDEVSMLSGEFLEEVEPMLRLARDNDLPAGGVQIVFAGDTIALEAPGSLQGVLVDRSRLHNQTDIAAIGDRRNIFYRIFPKDENIRGGLLGYLPKVSGLIQHLGIDLGC